MCMRLLNAHLKLSLQAPSSINSLTYVQTFNVNDLGMFSSYDCIPNLECQAEMNNVFYYPDLYLNQDDVVLNGDAFWDHSNNVLEMTNSDEEVSSFWLETKVDVVTQQWVVEFTFKLNDLMFGLNADGIAFVLHNDPDKLLTIGKRCSGDNLCHGFSYLNTFLYLFLMF